MTEKSKDYTYYRIHYFTKEVDEHGSTGDRYDVVNETKLAKKILDLQRAGKGIVSVGIYRIDSGNTSFERPDHKGKVVKMLKKGRNK